MLKTELFWEPPQNRSVDLQELQSESTFLKSPVFNSTCVIFKGSSSVSAGRIFC